LGGDIVIRRS